MTLVNAWWHRNDGREAGPERRAFIQCDGCSPPHMMLGSAERLAQLGWRFKDLEEGPHYCRWCRPRWRRGKRRRLYFPEERPALPNLVLIGAPKCGSTSLHQYLSLHQDIHMSRAKEVNFFQDPRYHEKLSYYATFFDERGKVRGESSTVYAWHPIVVDVPERIHATIPDAKLIYLVRDPIDRTVSHYVQRASEGLVRDRLEDVIKASDDPYNPFVAVSRYATQLERYLEVFPSERILVVDQAELLHDREGTIRTVFRFLGVDDKFFSPAFTNLANTAAAKRQKTPVYHALSRSSPAAALRRRLSTDTRKTLLAPIRRVTTRELEPPTLSTDARQRLGDILWPEVERLRALTGQEFASWQI